MMTKNVSDDGPVLAVIRQVLLAIVLLEIVGTTTELILLDHTEDIRQWIPLVLLAVALVAFIWQSFDRGEFSTRLIRWLMISFIGAGLAGVYFHFQGSAEFKLESNPSLRGWPLFWAAVRAKTPPLLAPGAMIQLGLLGWVYTYNHPALYRNRQKGEHDVSQ
ncbi:MAG TPA: hypothetical protein VGA27_01940 [Candidatus Binatia bacterium]